MQNVAYTVPRVLTWRQVGAYLAGYCAAVAVGIVLCPIAELQGFYSPWLAIAILCAPAMGYAVWAARRHRNYHFAAAGPLIASIVTPPPVLVVFMWGEPDDGFGPEFVLMVLWVMVGFLTWVAACIAGLPTVRWMRGRWD